MNINGLTLEKALERETIDVRFIMSCSCGVTSMLLGAQFLRRLGRQEVSMVSAVLA